jgi:hypothetical protein
VNWTGPAEKGGSFLVTANGWNEDRPFPSADWRPRYTPAKPDDPDTGTADARRRGAFSVAAAGEATISGGQLARIAVIGQGEVFHGAQLDPARERLLLVTTNWLLGRDDYLPTEEHPWSYPRLNQTSEPSEPSEQPKEPEQPAQPENPEQPEKPGKPGKPGKPEIPEKVKKVEFFVPAEWWLWGGRVGLPVLFAFVGAVVLLFRRLR